MQLKKPGFWLILAFGLTLGLLDNFPSEGNLQRLPLLTEQAYVVSRLLMQTGVLLLFGFMFLVSNRIREDRKSGTLDLFMAAPVDKFEYITGKISGNFILLLVLMGIYLLINACVQAIFNPAPFTAIPYLTGFFANVVPACFFLAGCSVCLPALADIRLVYFIFSVYFMANIMIVPGDSTMLPFFFILGGDLIKLVYRYGFGITFYANLLFNLVFLLGLGLLPVLILIGNRRFWRAE